MYVRASVRETCVRSEVRRREQQLTQEEASSFFIRSITRYRDRDQEEGEYGDHTRGTERTGTLSGAYLSAACHSCKYGCEWNQHYNCAIECKLSREREIVQNYNYPIQKWSQPHESYIARAPKEVLERAIVGDGKPTDHTNHSGSHHSTIDCIIGKGPPPCWPN